MGFDDLSADVLKDHSGELLMVVLALIGFVTVLIVLPQVLRFNAHKAEMLHQEHLRAVEKGLPVPIDDGRTRMAGRTALLVPIVVMASAGTVTCFLIVYKSENLFATSLAIWVVAGVVSLAAITGGVALIGRLAQIQARQEDDEEEPSENEYAG